MTFSFRSTHEFAGIEGSKMHKAKLLFLSGMVLAIFTLQSPAAFSADEVANLRVDVANGQAIYNEGKGEAMGCGGCHGATALGMDAMAAPRLANLGQKYILKQFEDYSNGKRNDDGMGAAMNDISKALNEQDRHDLAAYLDSLDYAWESSDLVALAAAGGKVGDVKKGKVIMTDGIKPLVPACQACHGLSGRAANIPAIHQQKYVYLVNQMNRYRDGNRNNDQKVGKDGIMRGISKNLSRENIQDIAAYLSTVSSVKP